MALNQIVTIYSDGGYPTSAAFTKPLTFAGGQVKGSAGYLAKAVVTTLFAGASGVLTFYDSLTGATGNVLLVIPTAAAVGTVYTIDLPVLNGIYAVNTSLTGGAVTIGFS